MFGPWPLSNDLSGWQTSCSSYRTAGDDVSQESDERADTDGRSIPATKRLCSERLSVRVPITILILATVSSAAAMDWAGRLKTALTSAKTLFANFFEWFGEFSIFCGRLVRAAFV